MMNEIIKTTSSQENIGDFSLKDFFVPLTNLKVITWIIVIGLAVFINMLFNGFVWDDTESIVSNSIIHSVSNIGYFFTGSTFNSGGQGNLVGLYYKPLITTIFSILYVFSENGKDAFIYHLVQLIVHIANTTLLFIFLSYFIRRYLAFFLSLIFLIHPMNVEAVSFISSLEDPLFFLFGMITLIFVKMQSITLKSGAIISMLLLLSVLSKETGFLFIFIIGFYLFLFDKKKLSQFFLSIIPTITLYAVLRLLVAKIYFTTQPVFTMTRLPLFERLKSIPEIIYYYLKNFFYPKNLAIAQDWAIYQISFQTFYFPLILSILFFSCLVFLGLFIWKQNKKMLNIYLFFCTFFFLSFLIHWQIFPLDLTTADRWFYMPMAGLLGALGIFIQSTLGKNLYSKKFLIIFVFAVLISVLSIRTMVRNTNWKNEATLYRHDIQVNADSYELQSNYGLVLLREGKIQEGQFYLIKSTTLAPFRWSSWTNLGASYEMEKDYVHARKYYEIAMSKGPFYSAYENYAHLLVFHDSPQNAEVFCKKAVTIFPLNSNLWLYLALAEYKLGNKQGALEAARNSYQLSPNQNNYYVYSNLMENQPLEIK